MRLWFKKPQEEAAPQAVADLAEKEGRDQKKNAAQAPSPAVERAASVIPPVVPPLAAVSARPSSVSNQQPDAVGKVGVSYKSDHRSLYKQLLAGLYDAVLITDPKGHIIDINARVTEFFNYNLEETWDLPISDLIPGVNTALIARIRQGLSGERFVLIDGRCIRKDRSTFAAEVAISSIDLMNEGDLVFSIRNVDRRHVQMQRLKSCQSLLNHLSAAAAACDADGNIKVANAPLARLLGYAKADDLTDKPLSVIWKEAGSSDVVRRVLAGESWKEVVQVVSTSGTRLQMTLNLAPERDARKKVVGILAALSPASVVALGGTSAKGG